MKAWQKKKKRSKQRVIAASVKQDLDFATPLTKKEKAKINSNKRRNRKIKASQFRAAYHQLREIRDTLELLDADVIDDLLRSLPAEVAAAYYGSDGNNTSDIPMFGDPEEVYNVIMDVIGGVRMV